MKKMIYRNNESFKADIEVAHFGDKPLVNQVILCRILDSAGEVIDSKTFTKDLIENGNCINIGSVEFGLSGS